MIFSTSDLIQLAMILVSLSVFVLKPPPSYLKVYPLYFTCGLMLGFYTEYTSNKGIHNTGVVNFYDIADFIFTCLVLRGFITNSKVRRIIVLSLFIFTLGFIINLVFIQKKVGFNPINFTVQSLIVAALCIYYFFELFQKTEVLSLSGLPAFLDNISYFF